MQGNNLSEEEEPINLDNFGMPELQEMIEAGRLKYLAEKGNTKTRKQYKQEYKDLMKYYNKRVGFVAYEVE